MPINEATLPISQIHSWAQPMIIEDLFLRKLHARYAI